MRLRRVALLIASLLWLPAPGLAQDHTQQSTTPPPIGYPSEFLLGRPKGLLAVRGGWLFANTGSDLYDFVSNQLTVDKKSFNASSLAGDFGISFGSRFDVIATLEQANSTTASEYRDFVDTGGVPITQTTRREEWVISGTLRMALLPRGRRISRFAWVPRAFTPYVGAGAGAVKYTFQQYGSFVDFRTLRVFNDDFGANGWAPTVHALGGADLRVWRRIYLTSEARYTWSSATLGQDFVDFEPLALGGLRLSGGLQVVF
ncbi:MAG: hypothetical protein AB7H93_18350 [Vicinamibacterales bacterium]